MNADAWKKRLLLHLPYGVIGLAAAKLSEAWRLSAGTDFSAKFLHLRDGAAMAFRNGMSGFVPLDLLIGFLCGCALCLLVHAKRRNAKKYRHGEEYGAARWGKPSDIAPFMDADPWNNIILTQTESLTMSSRPKIPKSKGLISTTRNASADECRASTVNSLFVFIMHPAPKAHARRDF